MGYVMIRPKKGGYHSMETFTVSKTRIYISKALTEKLGLHLRRKAVVILVEKETGVLCFDFKDLGQLRDAFPVCVHINRTNGMSCVVYCGASIEEHSIPLGRYSIVEKDGSIYKTDCIVNL